MAALEAPMIRRVPPKRRCPASFHVKKEGDKGDTRDEYHSGEYRGRVGQNCPQQKERPKRPCTQHKGVYLPCADRRMDILAPPLDLLTLIIRTLKIGRAGPRPVGQVALIKVANARGEDAGATPKGVGSPPSGRPEGVPLRAPTSGGTPSMLPRTAAGPRAEVGGSGSEETKIRAGPGQAEDRTAAVAVADVGRAEVDPGQGAALAESFCPVADPDAPASVVAGVGATLGAKAAEVPFGVARVPPGAQGAR